MQIGIIGFGRFGQFAAGVLKKDFEVFAYDKRKTPRKHGIRIATLPEVAQKPIVLLCIPISQVESICHQLKPYMRPGQLVLDTCSVKERPLRAMSRILPQFVEILGTHPLFGPDSARTGIEGMKIVICQQRCRQQRKIKFYLESLGLKVIEATAQQHDRQMAESQALFHFLARGVAQLRISPDVISTPGPAKMFQDFGDVRNDSLQLFRDLQRFNPFAPSVRRKLIDSLIRIDRELAKK